MNLQIRQKTFHFVKKDIFDNYFLFKVMDRLRKHTLFQDG
jgi:hypothetical protein